MARLSKAVVLQVLAERYAEHYAAKLGELKLARASAPHDPKLSKIASDLAGHFNELCLEVYFIACNGFDFSEDEFNDAFSQARKDAQRGDGGGCGTL